MKSQFKPTHSISLNVPRSLKANDVHNANEQGEKCWCLHCERVYDWGDYIAQNGLQWCPYKDCNGDTFMDSWSWNKIREAHPDYPENPDYDKVYPLYND